LPVLPCLRLNPLRPPRRRLGTASFLLPSCRLPLSPPASPSPCPLGSSSLSRVARCRLSGLASRSPPRPLPLLPVAPSCAPDWFRFRAVRGACLRCGSSASASRPNGGPAAFCPFLVCALGPFARTSCICPSPPCFGTGPFPAAPAPPGAGLSAFRLLPVLPAPRLLAAFPRCCGGPRLGHGAACRPCHWGLPVPPVSTGPRLLRPRPGGLLAAPPVFSRASARCTGAPAWPGGFSPHCPLSGRSQAFATGFMRLASRPAFFPAALSGSWAIRWIPASCTSWARLPGPGLPCWPLARWQSAGSPALCWAFGPRSPLLPARCSACTPLVFPAAPLLGARAAPGLCRPLRLAGVLALSAPAAPCHRAALRRVPLLARAWRRPAPSPRWLPPVVPRAGPFTALPFAGCCHFPAVAAAPRARPRVRSAGRCRGLPRRIRSPSASARSSAVLPCCSCPVWLASCPFPRSSLLVWRRSRWRSLSTCFCCLPSDCSGPFPLAGLVRLCALRPGRLYTAAACCHRPQGRCSCSGWKDRVVPPGFVSRPRWA